MAAKRLLLCTYDFSAFFMEICKKQVENRSLSNAVQLHKLS